MRKATKVVAGIFGLGSIAIGYQAGTAAEVSTPFADSAASASQPTNSSTPLPSASASATTEQTATGTTTETNTAASQAPAPVVSTSASSAPVASKAPASSSASTKSKQSDAIPYRFGTIQVTVVKTGSKITDVVLDIAGATGGRQQAFPYLVQYTVDANGTNYGNLSGATYTVVAFKQAVESALAKF